MRKTSQAFLVLNAVYSNRLIITDLDLTVNASAIDHLKPFERFEPLNVPGPLT